MPKCKNDPNRTYKGDEPSPKGLGICAHAEKLNSVKKGKDGNKWVVNKTKNGIKRWVKINPNESNGDKIKLFIKSNNFKKIVLKYMDNFNNIWSQDLGLTSKKLKKITISIVKKALIKYLNTDIKHNPDREEIINTGKWTSYNDTLVREKVIDFIIHMI